MVSTGSVKRDWRVILAFGLAALVVGAMSLAAWNLVGPRNPQVAGYEPPGTPKHAEQAGGEWCNPDQLSTIRSAIKREAERKRCHKEEGDRAASDESLRQSVRAANAAEQAVLISHYQAKALFWQTLATVGAFFAAIVAAYFAAKAVTVTRHSMQVATRAYFAIDAIHHDLGPPILQPHDVVFDLDIVATNSGQTPARDVFVRAEMISSLTGVPTVKLAERKTVGAGGRLDFRITGREPSKITDLEQGRYSVDFAKVAYTLVITATYRDIFKNQQVSTASFVLLAGEKHLMSVESDETI